MLRDNLRFQMSVYARFKRNPDGFRKLVELLESTAASRRQKMIDVGMEEDPDYTKKALEYVLEFEDVVRLPEAELCEVCAKAPPRMLGYAVNQQPEEIQQKFLRCSKPAVAVEIRDFFDAKLGAIEISGARLKIIETTRELERKGLVQTKKIPV
jgi:flagellar motor switch protein FliG